MATTGYINLEQLKTLYSKGEVDTVIMAFTDMQGRLIGKRVAARHFLDNIADHGAECCNYLLAVDIENNTIQGYEISSWDTGYADMAMIPDMKTMRMAPWLPGSVIGRPGKLKPMPSFWLCKNGKLGLVYNLFWF